jgi:hypothetical protein
MVVINIIDINKRGEPLVRNHPSARSRGLPVESLCVGVELGLGMIED